MRDVNKIKGYSNLILYYLNYVGFFKKDELYQNSQKMMGKADIWK